MLRGRLTHPDVLATLATAGHGARVLIADGNYPFSTAKGPNARLVSLNLAPGVVQTTQVLQALAASIPIEAALVMERGRSDGDGYEDPPVWEEYQRILAAAAADVELDRLERFAFYHAARGEDVALVIATGDQRLYANLMLTIGVVTEGHTDRS